ncbi:MAG TPA: hypothetical protein DDZ81_13165 [Acetobacteraceae bacterium]|nr:hypothetical protein [Acetobacteraceae bacterium]
MGLFDDAVPGGSIAKPLMIALGALLVGKMIGGVGQPRSDSSSNPSPQPDAGGPGAMFRGGLAGGLSSLLERLTSTGQGDVANSWVGTGPNKPIQPNQLGSALGQTTIADLARQTGMSEQELLAQLSRVLPNVVDKLTPGGRISDRAEIASHFGR